jgi:hypothetical protein
VMLTETKPSASGGRRSEDLFEQGSISFEGKA